jgi:hypothetical protein
MPTPTYTANKTLDAFFGNTATPSHGTLYICLHTADPTITGAVAEVASSNGYARASITNNTSNFPAASAGAKANAAAITFPAATGSGWGTVTHYSIKDASSGGNCIAYGPLPAAKTVVATDVITIPVGALTPTMPVG